MCPLFVCRLIAILFEVKQQAIMQATIQNPLKVRIPQKYKSDYSFIRAKFVEIAEDESQNFSIDPSEKNRFKTMLIEYLNLLLKAQRDHSEFVDEESSSQEEDEEQEVVDELFEQKTKLLSKALASKVEQCQKTQTSQMNIELDISKPEHMFVLKNGEQMPIEGQLDFSELQQASRKVKQIQDQQALYSARYQEFLSHQKWLTDQKY